MVSLHARWPHTKQGKLYWTLGPKMECCYPVNACAKGLMNRFCQFFSLSVSQSVSVYPKKSLQSWNQHIYCVKQLLYAAIMWQSKKNMYVYLIETKAAHFSAFPAVLYCLLFWYGQPLGYTVETRHMRTPSMCSRSPASSFPGLWKAERVAGSHYQRV